MAAAAQDAGNLSSLGSPKVAEAYNSCFGVIFAYCTYRLFHRDMAEDATAATFLRMVEKWPSLKGKTHAEIRNWLYGTASNVIARHLKDAKRSREVIADCARLRGSCDENADQGAVDWAVLYAAMSKLPISCQELITLRYFQRVGIQEIAAILKIKPGTLRVRLSRALRSLREALTRKGD